MFHKENSSIIGSDNKKGKDTPVRKSDRKRLLETACDTLLARSNSNSNSSISDGEDRKKKNKALLLLEDVFLKGTLIQRPLKLPGGISVSLFFRSPYSNTEKQDTSSNNTLSDDGYCCWPYTQTTQCVWLQVQQQHQNNKSSVVQQVPGLALLTVILQCDVGLPTTGVGEVEVPSHVSKFVCRGANLMRAGVVSILSPSSQNNNSSNDAVSVVAVKITGNPQPFAVGLLHPDLHQQLDASSSSSSLYGPGTKGTAVTVIHSYGDDIWRKQQQQPHTSNTDGEQLGMIMNAMGGAPFDNGHYGNVGFVDGQYVVPIITAVEHTTTTKASSEVIDASNTGIESTESDTAVEPPSLEAVAATPTASGETDANTVPELANDESIDEENKSAKTEQERSPEDVLHASVCAALVSLNVKKDLPMLMSTFYAQHVLHSRPEGCTVQLKQTKWKKFGVYVAEQVQNGLITAGPATNTSSKDSKQQPKDPLAMLTSYDRRHPDLEKYIQMRTDNPVLATDDKKNSSKNRLVLVQLYCIPNHVVVLLRLDRDSVKAVNATSVERRNTGMLTIKELRAILEDYIAREELTVNSPRPDQVNLDGPLTDVLYKKKKKKNSPSSSNNNNRDGQQTTTPTSLARKELMKLWEALQEPAYALVQLPGNTIIKLARGSHPIITIEVSRRQSKKFVTRVTGNLAAYGIAPEAFSKDVAHRFACSATVTPPSSASSKNTELLFQGNLADELEALLLSDESLTSHGGAKGSTYHLPKDAIEVVLRKGVPARKKRSGKKK